MLRPVCDKRVSETRESLESMDMDYVLKINEYLDQMDYIQDIQHEANKPKQNY